MSRRANTRAKKRCHGDVTRPAITTSEGKGEKKNRTDPYDTLSPYERQQEQPLMPTKVVKPRHYFTNNVKTQFHRSLLVRSTACVEKCSTIPGAGNGLFAKELLSPGMVLHYTGRVVVGQAEMDKFDTTYALEHPPNSEQFVIGYSPAAKVNEPTCVEQVNCDLWGNDDATFVAVLFPILPGQELFARYGDEYPRSYETKAGHGRAKLTRRRKDVFGLLELTESGDGDKKRSNQVQQLYKALKYNLEAVDALQKANREEFPNISPVAPTLVQSFKTLQIQKPSNQKDIYGHAQFGGNLVKYHEWWSENCKQSKQGVKSPWKEHLKKHGFEYSVFLEHKRLYELTQRNPLLLQQTLLTARQLGNKDLYELILEKGV